MPSCESNESCSSESWASVSLDGWKTAALGLGLEPKEPPPDEEERGEVMAWLEALSWAGGLVMGMALEGGGGSKAGGETGVAAP